MKVRVHSILVSEILLLILTFETTQSQISTEESESAGRNSSDSEIEELPLQKVMVQVVNVTVETKPGMTIADVPFPVICPPETELTVGGKCEKPYEPLNDPRDGDLKNETKTEYYDSTNESETNLGSTHHVVWDIKSLLSISLFSAMLN